jgi:nucleoid-associated protein YgaU
MSRTRVRRRRFEVLLAGVGILLVFAGPAMRGVLPSEPPRLVSVHAYTVRPGDTVWAIAQRVGERGQDPRPLVDSIMRENHLGSALTPGQILSIPSG